MAEDIVVQLDSLEARLKSALHDADLLTQTAEDRITAACGAITALMKEPDSVPMRLKVVALCEIIESQAYDTMNSIGVMAEGCGVNYENEGERQLRRAISAAVSGSASHEVGAAHV